VCLIIEQRKFIMPHYFMAVAWQRGLIAHCGCRAALIPVPGASIQSLQSPHLPRAGWQNRSITQNCLKPSAQPNEKWQKALTLNHARITQIYRVILKGASLNLCVNAAQFCVSVSRHHRDALIRILAQSQQRMHRFSC
jgi:hypothetical protein